MAAVASPTLDGPSAPPAFTVGDAVAEAVVQQAQGHSL